MKFRIGLAMLVIFALPQVVAAAEVKFLIEGLRNSQGKVMVGIYLEEAFLKKGKEVAECQQQGSITSGKATVVCNLEPGTYGAGVFHDENDNNEFDTNFVGIPKEGYGFSNNAKHGFGPPEFADAAFSVDSQGKELQVKLKY